MSETGIDWARVQELREEIGEEDFAEVVDVFLEEVDEVVLRLREGTIAGSLEEELHFLKGSALNLGLSDLAELCRSGEEMAREGRAGEVDVPPILASYQSSRGVLVERCL